MLGLAALHRIDLIEVNALSLGAVESAQSLATGASAGIGVNMLVVLVAIVAVSFVLLTSENLAAVALGAVGERTIAFAFAAGFGLALGSGAVNQIVTAAGYAISVVLAVLAVGAILLIIDGALATAGSALHAVSCITVGAIDVAGGRACAAAFAAIGGSVAGTLASSALLGADTVTNIALDSAIGAAVGAGGSGFTGAVAGAASTKPV